MTLTLGFPPQILYKAGQKKYSFVDKVHTNVKSYNCEEGELK